MEDYTFPVEAHNIGAASPSGEYLEGTAITIKGRPFIPLVDLETRKVFLTYMTKSGRVVTEFISLTQLLRTWAEHAERET